MTKSQTPGSQGKLFSLSLLGPFKAEWDGQPAAGLRTQKERALLAYLAVQPERAHPRDALAELLWPGRPPGRALTSLRQALAGVRRAVGEECLATTRNTVQFNMACSHWLDVTIFRRHFEAVRTHLHDDVGRCPICMGRLGQAVALYRGDFLSDLAPVDSLAVRSPRCGRCGRAPVRRRCKPRSPPLSKGRSADLAGCRARCGRR